MTITKTRSSIQPIRVRRLTRENKNENGTITESVLHTFLRLMHRICIILRRMTNYAFTCTTCAFYVNSIIEFDMFDMSVGAKIAVYTIDRNILLPTAKTGRRKSVRCFCYYSYLQAGRSYSFRGYKIQRCDRMHGRAGVALFIKHRVKYLYVNSINSPTNFSFVAAKLP